MDLVASYRCDCRSGYTGSNCETGQINKLSLCSSNYISFLVDFNPNIKKPEFLVNMKHHSIDI